jgi:hypothetical protein
MGATSSTNVRRLGAKRFAVACASCALGLALMILLFGLGSNSQRDSTKEEKNSPIKAEPKKPQPAWNVALGNVVVIASELGFDVRAPKNAKIELSRVNGRIEAQLLAVRELYRLESDKNANLMGGLFLQLTLGSGGEVASVKELGWRITDGDFRKAVVAEVAKWDFQDTAPEGTTINCPLLFVREGMEITTLVRWEKTLGLFEERTAVNDASNRPAQENTPAPVTPPSPRRGKKPVAFLTRPSKQSHNDSEIGQGLDAF